MIKPLTSLRFIFALMVFCAHCYTIDPHFSHSFYKEGFVGVNFFFMLSGFIIAYNYRNKISKGEITKKQFWIARIARIYPLHLLTLFISVLLGGYVATDSIDWIKHFLANFFLLQPYIPSEDYFFSFNSPSWSLGCEQLFYFLYPLLAVWLAGKKKLLLLILALAFVIPFSMYMTEPSSIKALWYVNPITRLPDFLIGMLLFNIYDNYKDSEWSYLKATFYEISAIALFLLFVILANDFVPKVYRYSVYYWTPIALLLFVFAYQRGAVSRLLSNRYLMIGGEISFSFYLIHLLVIDEYSKINAVYNLNIPSVIDIPLILLVTTGLSLLSYYYFEKPSNRFVKKLLNKK